MTEWEWKGEGEVERLCSRTDLKDQEWEQGDVGAGWKDDEGSGKVR